MRKIKLISVVMQSTFDTHVSTMAKLAISGTCTGTTVQIPTILNKKTEEPVGAGYSRLEKGTIFVEVVS